MESHSLMCSSEVPKILNCHRIGKPNGRLRLGKCTYPVCSPATNLPKRTKMLPSSSFLWGRKQVHYLNPLTNSLNLFLQY